MKKIPVAILGATGMVGQKFIELLHLHPWFEIVALAASPQSVGKKYKDVVNWLMPSILDSKIGNMKMQSCHPGFPCQIVFSALDSSVAEEIEKQFAEDGYIVVSNCKNYRMHPNVPLIVPEVNADHLDLVKTQTFSKKGMIVTNPNCSVIGITLALKPLIDKIALSKIHIVTLQAISGAGHPGVASLDILDNIIPYIDGEEEKLETEPLKILGSLERNAIKSHAISISAQCNRVAVNDGHMACISIQTEEKIQRQEIIDLWNNFHGNSHTKSLPSAPKTPIVYHEEKAHPQPKKHRLLENGMGVSIGRLRECPLFSWKFIVLTHNTIRGAAGSAILNAELLVKNGFVE